MPKFLEGFPKPPKISEIIIKRANPLREVIDDAHNLIRSGKEEIADVAKALRVEGQVAPPKPETVGSEEKTTPTIASQEPETVPQQIATACVACALGHFSTSAGLLNEAIRFKGEDITSNEILDRIAKTLEEQNSLERVDLTPEKLQRTPEWEKEIAEEALQESRKLRHKLEGITSIDELEQTAADTSSYYKKMNRQWYKGRFAHLGKEKAEAIEKRINPEDKERIKERAKELIEEV